MHFAQKIDLVDKPIWLIPFGIKSEPELEIVQGKTAILYGKARASITAKTLATYINSNPKKHFVLVTRDEWGGTRDRLLVQIFCLLDQDNLDVITMNPVEAKRSISQQEIVKIKNQIKDFDWKMVKQEVSRLILKLNAVHVIRPRVEQQQPKQMAFSFDQQE